MLQTMRYVSCIVPCLVLLRMQASGDEFNPNDVFNQETMKSRGHFYEATVPDTLDLAERARLSVHGLTSFLNPRANYAPYGHTYFNANPPYMSDMPGGPPNWGKIAESLIMARIMCGSEENLQVEEKMWHGMLSPPVQRPGGGAAYSADYLIINPAAPTPLSRVMLALMALYQLDPHSDLKKRLNEMADGHCRVAQYQNDYAYYTDPPTEERDTMLGILGYWLPVFIQGCAIRSLARWSAMNSEEKYLKVAGELTNFLLQPKYWVPEAGPKAVFGPDQGHFSGHHHAYTQGLMGLLWYADITNDARLKQFVRSSYEYMRNFGIARIGLFGETCTTGDLTFLAVKLSDMGVGDYWEDVDQYIRNHLTELQITDAEKLSKAVEDMPHGRGKNDTTEGPFDFANENETTDSVIQRNVGVFLSDSTHPTLIPEHSFLYTICCTGNCTPALYLAWEAIVRCQDDAAQVNLLLNRASQWLDIDSYLPYEGKVIIRNKTARKLSVRIPRWVDKKKVQSQINGLMASAFWAGQYLVFDTLNAGDVITITFPVVETREKYTLKWKQSEFWKESTNPGNSWTPLKEPSQYTFHFRGNTLVDISPRDKGTGYPLYLRNYLKQDKAPMKKVTRYISTIILKW